LDDIVSAAIAQFEVAARQFHCTVGNNWFASRDSGN